MKNPKLKVPKDNLDWILDGVALLAVIACFVIVINNYSHLPKIIPHHFGLDGRPDRFGSKSIIWLLPAITFLLFVGTTYLNRFPHVFNYPKKITEENAAYQYRLATKLVRFVNTVITIMLAYLTWSMIQFAISRSSEGLSMWSAIPFIIIILGALGFYYFKSSKKIA